jgi:DNA-binding transcriptional regulator YiaG
MTPTERARDTFRRLEMSPTAFAALFGTTPSHVNQWLNGRIGPTKTAQAAMKMAVALKAAGVNLYFFTKDDE